MVHTGTVYKTSKKLKLFDAPFGGNVLGFVDRDSFVIATDARKKQRRVRVVYPQPGYVNIALGHLKRSKKPISDLLKYTSEGVVMQHAPKDFDGQSSSSSGPSNRAATKKLEPAAKPAPKPKPEPLQLPKIKRDFSDLLTDDDSDDDWLNSPTSPPKRAEAEPEPKPEPRRGTPTPPRVPYHEVMGAFHELLLEATVEFLAEVAADAYEEYEQDVMIEQICAAPAAPKPPARALTLFRVQFKSGEHRGKRGTVQQTEGSVITVKLDRSSCAQPEEGEAAEPAECQTVQASFAELRYLDEAVNYSEWAGLWGVGSGAETVSG